MDRRLEQNPNNLTSVSQHSKKVTLCPVGEGSGSVVGGQYSKKSGIGLATAGLILMGGGLIGCEAPIFAPDAPRTPYERYQQLHGRHRVTTEENAYGGQQPALRQRLRPLDPR